MIPSLSDQINAITRSHHTTLNQLILRLLPSALPPRASNPQNYAHGIAHFLPIYSAFEIPLRSLPALALPFHEGSIINRLYIPGLERSPSLKQDIEYLLQRPHLHSQELSLLHKKSWKDVKLEPSQGVYDRPKLNAFVTYISTAVVSRPHVLFAYTWIFYMALFQGGRYIRSKLLGVEEDGFWVRELSSKPATDTVTESVPLSFWEFPAATRDGEDLKTEFKARTREIEPSLSPAQRKEILQEAVEIMVQLLAVVREIDENFQEKNFAQSEQPLISSMMLANKETRDVDETSGKEEPAPPEKLLHFPMATATGVLTRLRSFFSFAPGEPLTVPVTVTDKLRE